MAKNNKKKFDYSLWESITLLLLRITLFICLLIIAFRNTDKWWCLALTIGTLAILVMFRRLDFFEIMRVLKAGTNYNIEERTDSDSSTTPKKISKDLKKRGTNITIKSDFPKEENQIYGFKN